MMAAQNDSRQILLDRFADNNIHKIDAKDMRDFVNAVYDEKLSVDIVEDTLLSNDKTKALSANQGNLLNQKIEQNTHDISQIAKKVKTNNAHIFDNKTEITRIDKEIKDINDSLAQGVSGLSQISIQVETNRQDLQRYGIMFSDALQNFEDEKSKMYSTITNLGNDILNIQNKVDTNTQEIDSHNIRINDNSSRISVLENLIKTSVYDDTQVKADIKQNKDDISALAVQMNQKIEIDALKDYAKLDGSRRFTNVYSDYVDSPIIKSNIISSDKINVTSVSTSTINGEIPQLIHQTKPNNPIVGELWYDQNTGMRVWDGSKWARDSYDDSQLKIDVQQNASNILAVENIQQKNILEIGYLKQEEKKTKTEIQDLQNKDKVFHDDLITFKKHLAQKVDVSHMTSALKLKLDKVLFDSMFLNNTNSITAKKDFIIGDRSKDVSVTLNEKPGTNAAIQANLFEISTRYQGSVSPDLKIISKNAGIIFAPHNDKVSIERSNGTVEEIATLKNVKVIDDDLQQSKQQIQDNVNAILLIEDDLTKFKGTTNSQLSSFTQQLADNTTETAKNQKQIVQLRDDHNADIQRIENDYNTKISNINTGNQKQFDDITNKTQYISTYDSNGVKWFDILLNHLDVGDGTANTEVVLYCGSNSNSAIRATDGTNMQWEIGMYPSSNTHPNDVVIASPKGGYVFDMNQTGKIRYRKNGQFGNILTSEDIQVTNPVDLDQTVQTIAQKADKPQTIKTIPDFTKITGGSAPTEAEFNSLVDAFNTLLTEVRKSGIIK